MFSHGISLSSSATWLTREPIRPTAYPGFCSSVGVTLPDEPVDIRFIGTQIYVVIGPMPDLLGKNPAGTKSETYRALRDRRGKGYLEGGQV